ncbi:MAG: Flp family type IVb pilin [Planctomycetota bacterium]|jgi:Flp pilus assembly pilin Flp
MREFVKSVRRFLVDESGPTSVEYLVMMMVIVFVIVGGVRIIGERTDAWFQTTKNKLPV